MLVRQVPGGIDGVLGVFGAQIASCEVAAELLLERRDRGTVLLAFLTAEFHQLIIGSRIPNSYLYLIIMLMSALIVLVLMVRTLVAGRALCLLLHAQGLDLPPILVRLKLLLNRLYQ